MRLRAIEMEGFRSFRDHERVDLAGVNFAAVVGQNHQGKSTLISSALEFGLFGRTTGETVTDAITRGEPKATVSIEFDLGDVTYRVTRTRTRKGRHEVYLAVADSAAESGWRSLEEKYAKSGADPFITSLLGMDSTTARATWLITQGDFGAFCEMDPAPRRQVLATAFGLDKFAELAEKAEANKRAEAAALDKATYDLTSLQNRVEALQAGGDFPDLDDAALAEKITAADAEVDRISADLAAIADDAQAAAALKAATEALADFDAIHTREVNRFRTDRARLDRDLTDATNRHTEAKKAHAKAEEAVWATEQAEQASRQAHDTAVDLENQAQDLREQYAQAQAEHATLTSRQQALQGNAAEIKERIGLLHTSMEKGAGECFACGQDLTGDRAETLVAAQEKHRADLRAEHDDLGQQAQQVKARMDDLAARGKTTAAQARTAQGQARDAAAEAARVAEAAGQVDLWADRVKQSAQRVEALEEEMLDLGSEPKPDVNRRRALAEAVTTAQQAVDAARDGDTKRQALTAERDTARARVRALWAEQDRRARVAEDVEALTGKITDAQKAVQAHQADRDAYEVLQDAFRPSGIPSMILAGVIEELNEEANDLLDVMGSDLGVVVTAQKETKKGTSQDKVMVYAQTPEGPVGYKTLSGQERYFLALALRMALATCIARRTGTPIETIVQDEGWGALDSISRTAVMGALERMAQQFNVYSVTHIDEIKSGFPTVIEVSAATGTSRATITNQ